VEDEYRDEGIEEDKTGLDFSVNEVDFLRE